MWILPKQLHISAYAADMKALESDLEQLCQMSENALLWRSKPSMSPTWFRRWKRVKFIQHLFTRILKPSHTENFVDAWTSYLEASHVSHSAMLEIVKQLKIQDTCSHTSETEYENADQELFSLKTLKELFQPKQEMANRFCDMSSENWKSWVTQQRQEYSQRVKLAHRINAKEFTFLGWPTPTAAEGTKIGSQPNYGQIGLSNHPAIVGQPDREKLKKSGKRKECWPTPRANKVHPTITEENRKELANRNKANLEEDVAGHCGKATGKLNPNWVEQLMGLPVGWTQLPTDWID